MKIVAYEKKEDGSLRLENPIIVDSENIPESLYLADEGTKYYYQSADNEPERLEPQEPTLEERIQALEVMELERILGGGF